MRATHYTTGPATDPMTKALNEARAAHIEDGVRRYVAYGKDGVEESLTCPRKAGRYYKIDRGTLTMVVRGWATAGRA